MWLSALRDVTKATSCRGAPNRQTCDLLREVAEVCRRVGVSEQTFYRRKKQFAGLGVAEVRELRPLRENATLKQLVADLTLDRHILQEVVRQKL